MILNPFFQSIFLKSIFSLASMDLIITFKIRERALKREKIYAAQLKEMLNDVHEEMLMRFFNTAINRLRKNLTV